FPLRDRHSAGRLISLRRNERPVPTCEEMMALSRRDQSDRSSEQRFTKRARPDGGSERDGRAAHGEALRIAIETLSAELCWHLATDTGAHATAVRSAARRSSMDSALRRPRS